MRAARVEGIEGVDGPGEIVSRRPERGWGGDGGTALDTRERMWFFRKKENGGGLQHFSISLGLCVPNFFVWICFCGPGATGTFVPDSLFPRLGEGEVLRMVFGPPVTMARLEKRS